jgi:hypothetical protein
MSLRGAISAVSGTWGNFLIGGSFERKFIIPSPANRRCDGLLNQTTDSKLPADADRVWFIFTVFAVTAQELLAITETLIPRETTLVARIRSQRVISSALGGRPVQSIL